MQTILQNTKLQYCNPHVFIGSIQSQGGIFLKQFTTKSQFTSKLVFPVSLTEK